MGTLGPRHRLTDAVVEQESVRQVGQGVVVGHVPDAFLRPLFLGDVPAGATIALEAALLVEDRPAADAEDADLAAGVVALIREVAEGRVRREQVLVRLPFLFGSPRRPGIPSASGPTCGRRPG